MGAAITSEQLFATYHARVLSRGYRLLGNWQDAEDCASRCMFIAMSRLNTLRPGTPVHNWINGIMRNVCLDTKRSRNRHNARLAVAAAVARGTHAHTPESALIVKEMVIFTLATYGELKPTHRRCIAVAAVGDDMAAAAAEAGINHLAFRSRLFRAREKVKKEIGYESDV